MKPFKILIFLIVVLSLCLLLGYIFPEQGIVISPKITLNFSVALKDNSSPRADYADIDQIVESVYVEEDIDTLDIDLFAIDTVRANVKQLNATVQKIEYPAGDTTILFPFFNKLQKAKTSHVRVMHYGDSQIEGDRITGYLRNKMQRRFGGSGPGLMPAIPGHAKSASIMHEASKNWQMHAIYYKKDTILPHREFGLMGSFARYTSYAHDSLQHDTLLKTASISFSKSAMAYRSVRNFYECKVYYGHCHDSIVVKGYVNDSLMWFNLLDTTTYTKSFEWKFNTPPDKFHITFEGINSPDIYGISLDSKYGVAVDNLPFRGSSGTEFTKMNYQQQKKMLSGLNPGLVILEFGVNVVPFQVKNYKFYEQALTRQLKYLQYLMPKASFLVIGLSDMSMKKGNYYETYPNVEKIRKAQRNAAKNANCAFWDMYAAMGGKNSMPSWVFAEPSLAQKDFTHFNRKGGHIIAQMLFNAIMADYNAYELNELKLDRPL